MLRIIARLIRPLMIRLFPDVPPEHPAMGAMILNLSANALGLGNAATPFGIRAMQELDKLNSQPGTATNAMVLFLAIKHLLGHPLAHRGDRPARRRRLARSGRHPAHHPLRDHRLDHGRYPGGQALQPLVRRAPTLAAAGTTNGTPAPIPTPYRKPPWRIRASPIPCV